MSSPITPPEEPMLDFHKFLKILWRRRGIIQGVTAVCLILATLYGFLGHKVYQAVTTVKVPDSSSQSGANGQQTAFLSSSEDPIETSMQIALSDKVAAGAVSILKMESNDAAQPMDQTKLILYLQHLVKVDNVKRSNLLSITARAKTAVLAATLANAWAQSFIQVNQDLNQESEEARYQFLHSQLNSIRAKLEEDQSNKQNYLNQSSEAEADQLIYKSLLEQVQESRIRSNNENTGIVVVDAAPVPDKPVAPKKSVSIILGLMAGLLLGVSAAFARERLEDRVYEETDLIQVLHQPRWASLPLLPVKGGVAPPSLLLSQRDADVDYAQSFRSARAHLLLAHPEAGSLALGILSSLRGEGRTLATANLAICLAQAGKKVLAIDADLENPKLGEIFGVDTTGVPGLSGLLSGQASLKEATRPSGVPNLTLLPAPTGSTDFSGILSPAILKKWVGEAKSKFDYLLFDGAPLMISPDAAVICGALEGVLLLARWGFTGRRDLQQALERLRTARVPLWGTLLNGVEKKPGPFWDLKMASFQMPRHARLSSKGADLRAS